LGCKAGIELLKCALTEKAAELFHSCAAVPNADQAMALFQLGKLYESAQPVKAERYYKRAAELKLPQALYVLGEKALCSNDLEKAHKYFSAAAGFADAEFSHAQLHENKNFSGFSLKEALFRYEKACIQSKNEKKQALERKAVQNIRRIKRFLQSVEK
jgi:TPR repeat protein